jgi:hypothetical protein
VDASVSAIEPHTLARDEDQACALTLGALLFSMAKREQGYGAASKTGPSAVELWLRRGGNEQTD